MFTGIVQATGTIRAIDKRSDWRMIIDSDLDLSHAPPGASVCCAGCCLTVVEKGAGWFAVEVSDETLSKTTLGTWQAGRKINLEPSLRLGDELGGHFVFGHVDGVVKIESIIKSKDSYVLKIRVPGSLIRFIAPKGSVTLDGISLTVNAVGTQDFEVNTIPHTWAHTTLGQSQKGDSLNLEIDMLARYVDRLLEGRQRNAA